MNNLPGSIVVGRQWSEWKSGGVGSVGSKVREESDLRVVIYRTHGVTALAGWWSAGPVSARSMRCSVRSFMMGCVRDYVWKQEIFKLDPLYYTRTKCEDGRVNFIELPIYIYHYTDVLLSYIQIDFLDNIFCLNRKSFFFTHPKHYFKIYLDIVLRDI